MKETYKGKIIASVGGWYSVCITPTGACARIIDKVSARGLLRHDKITPLVGDEAEILYDKEAYVIENILPRKNSLLRPPLANLDALFIVTSAALPNPVEGFADKLTVICEKSGIVPVIIVTKCELSKDTAQSIVSGYIACGYGAFAVSATENFGIDGLREYILQEYAEKTVAFAGASGVGKSTLLNALYPQLCLQVGQISEKIGRGKNTTRRVSLYQTEGGIFIADTPGFGMLDFERFDFCDKEELPFLFPEFVPYLGKCKYTKCSHTKEDGCAIKKAISEGIISNSRYNSFLAIHENVKDKKEWD